MIQNDLIRFELCSKQEIALGQKQELIEKGSQKRAYKVPNTKQELYEFEVGNSSGKIRGGCLRIINQNKGFNVKFIPHKTDIEFLLFYNDDIFMTSGFSGNLRVWSLSGLSKVQSQLYSKYFSDKKFMLQEISAKYLDYFFIDKENRLNILAQNLGFSGQPKSYNLSRYRIWSTGFQIFGNQPVASQPVSSSGIPSSSPMQIHGSGSGDERRTSSAPTSYLGGHYSSSLSGSGGSTPPNSPIQSQSSDDDVAYF